MVDVRGVAAVGSSSSVAYSQRSPLILQSLARVVASSTPIRSPRRYRLTVLPGDGIGPEVTKFVALDVLQTAASQEGVHVVRELGPFLGKNARFFASLESDADKTDGARKALEQAFQGKSTVAKKWEEEIKQRELGASGDGGIGGRGGKGGGGGGWGGGDEDMGEGFDEEEPWDWDEVGQRTIAAVVLILLYCSITHGPKQILKLVKVFIRYVRQGFRLRKIPEEYLVPWSDSEDEYEGELDSEEGEVSVRASKRRVEADGTALESHRDVPSLLPPPSMQRPPKGDDVRSRREREKQQQLRKLMTPQQRKQMEEREQ